MNVREQLTLAAGLAVALATGALFPLYDGAHWFWRVLGAVGVVVVAGLLGRRLGLPRVLQPVLGLLALTGYLCVVFASQTLSYGVLPGSGTVKALQALVDAGRADVAHFGPPVPSTEGLVLLTAAGVGAIAVLVDLVAVVLDRAAVAGLPLLLLLAVPSAVLPGGLGGVPFVLGASGWLGLLLVEGSERVGRSGTPMRSARAGARPGGDDSSLGRVGRRIGFAAVGMAVLVPAVIPGLDERLVGGTGGAVNGGKGGSNQAVTYNPITRLQDELLLPTPRELLLYETDDPHPDYVRMTTLDRYTGNGWSASKLEADRENANVQDGVPPAPGDSSAHQDFTMRIAVVDDRLDVYWLPVPFGPRKVEVEGTWLWDAASQTVFSASRTTKQLEPYTVTASRPLPDRTELAAAEPSGVPGAVKRQYGGSLPVTSAVTRLTQSVIKGKTTAYDRAVALQAYFTKAGSGFVYDLQPSQPGPGEDELEAFLRGKHGFCEQYATAMAVLLRVAGIPSRVAVGFTPGAPVPGRARTFSISTSEAHAWPEAWFAGTGWVRFEPTPAASGATVPDYSVPARPGGDGGNVTPNDVTPTPLATTRPRTGQTDPDVLNRAPGAAGPQQTGSDSALPSRWLIAAVLVAVLLVAPYLLTRLRRHRRWAHAGPLTAWQQLSDDATDVGHRWHPSESPRAAAARLLAWRRLPPPAVAALERVAAAAERARYAPAGRALSSEALRGLATDAAVLRAALQDGSPSRVRLRARLFPSSTLQWTSEEIGARVAAVMGRVDDAISAVTRPLRRRAAG